jgi:hypothetical protein
MRKPGQRGSTGAASWPALTGLFSGHVRPEDPSRPGRLAVLLVLAVGVPAVVAGCSRPSRDPVTSGPLSSAATTRTGTTLTARDRMCWLDGTASGMTVDPAQSVAYGEARL